MAERPRRGADPEQAERLHTFAHDIKNRLGGLWEVLRMLHTNGGNGLDRDELLAFAERGFFNAQRDVESLLDDLGVDRGIVINEPLPFDPVACLHEAVKIENYRLQKKDQRVDITGSSGPRVRGDARWTTQLLQALISNASKFSPRGAVIHGTVTSSPTDMSIRIADHGCGLSSEDLQRIFTRYAILSSRSTNGEPQSRGTLGRAHQWAEAQGGTLTATSDGEGRGSAFTLTLPLA